MHLEDMDAVFHDHFENRHGEARQPVCETNSGIPIDDGRRRDAVHVLKVEGNEIVGCFPKEGQKILLKCCEH